MAFTYNPNSASRVGVSAGAGLDVPVHDFIQNSYNASNQLTSVVFKQGGSSGTVVATLTLAYDANANLTSVTRS